VNLAGNAKALLVRQLGATRLKVWIAVLIVASLLFPVGGAISRSAFKATIVIRSESPAIDGRLLLMDPSRGHYPSQGTSLEIDVTPAPQIPPQIAVTATHGIKASVGYSIRDSLPVLPADIGVERANTVGPFTITATVGPPVNEQFTVSGFAYEGIGLGCASGFAGGYRIDALGVPHETDTVRASDIYVMDTVLPDFIAGDRCPTAFRRQAGTKSTLHIPGGAIDLDDERATFPEVDGTRWKGPSTAVFDPAAVHGTLLWRTRDGRLMKTLVGTAGDNILGPTIVAGASGRFADNGWLRMAKPRQRSLSDAALSSLQYTAMISNYALPAYGARHPLELIKPYLNGAVFPHSPAIVCLHTDPQVAPDPSVTWSLGNDRTMESNRMAQLLAPEDLGFGVGYVQQGCQAIGNLQAGSLAITVSVGPPVSQRVTRVAAVYDTLVLIANPKFHAIRFVHDRPVYVEDRATSDLFLSNTGVLHFPAGGALFTNGTDPALSAPRMARRGSVFSELEASAWRNDRTTLSMADLHAADQPCEATKANGFPGDDSPCGLMAAHVLLFKTRSMDYVKLNIIDFFLVNGSLGGAFDVTDDKGRFRVRAAVEEKCAKTRQT